MGTQKLSARLQGYVDTLTTEILKVVEEEGSEGRMGTLLTGAAYALETGDRSFADIAYAALTNNPGAAVAALNALDPAAAVEALIRNNLEEGD